MPDTEVKTIRATGVNPLLSRRMVNAHARLSGCGEHDPDFQCEHRIMSRREMEKLLALYEAEKGMSILAIDPGSEKSAWLVFANGKVAGFSILPNDHLADLLRKMSFNVGDVVVIEKVESYGMAVGREVFDTVYWTGRFTEALHGTSVTVVQMPRRTVKMTLCGQNSAKDSNIRAALIDMFGGNRVAKGTKSAPGPLYGVSNDVWSALAVAVTYYEQHKGNGDA